MDDDVKLLEGLRALAADGAREAPASVEERLLGEFRRRSRARRRNFRVTVGAGAIAAGLAAMLWIRPTPVAPRLSINAPAAAADDAAALDFYPLPDADYLPPLESATVVRVQLPMSSLRLMGWQVSEDRSPESVQADVLLGQDGLARGVRFVE